MLAMLAGRKSLTPTPEHEIILVCTEEERQQCFDVRVQVFHKEQKFPLETEFDDKEDEAAHFLLRLTPSLSPIGTIRCYKLPDNQKISYKLTRLAVLKQYRQFRFGRALVLTLHDWVRKRQAPSTEIERFEDNNTDITLTTTCETHPDTTDKSSVEITVHSQIPVTGFYVKFGYVPVGDEFDEEGEPHQKMIFRLPS